MPMKASVIIPVHNSERFLSECLDSLLIQTVPDIEIICIDDGSTDSSAAILSEYAKRDERVRAIFQEQSGAGAARNVGIENAAGDWLFFLDSDDYFEEDLVESVTERGDHSAAQVVLYGACTFHDVTGERSVPSHYFKKEIIENTPVFSRRDYPETILSICSPAPWNKAFSRHYVIEQGLRFQNLPNSNDVFFSMMTVALADRIAWVDKVLVNYRIGTSTSLQSGNRRKNPACFATAYRAVFDALKQKGIYHDLEKSFTAVALSGAAYNLNSAKSHSMRQAVIEAVASDGFQQMGLLSHEADYYPVFAHYTDVRGAVCANRYMRKSEVLRKGRQSFRVLTDCERRQADVSVSVVMPIFNVEKYLQATLDSVLGQTLNSIEIICVVDGATDGSLQIVLDAANSDNRVVPCIQDNMGQAAARNHGASIACGQYIYFMDSDDLLEKNALSRAFCYAQQNELDVLYFDGRCIFEEEASDLALSLRDKYQRKSGEAYSGISTGIDMFVQMSSNDDIEVSPCLQIIRRDYLVQSGICFHEGTIHEDNAFTLGLMLSSSQVGYLHEQLFIRRYRAGSTMTAKESFANAYGYFVAFADLNKLVRTKLHIDESAESVFRKEALRRLNNAIRVYAELPEWEKDGIWGLCSEEAFQFECLVVQPASWKAEAMKKQRLLQRTYDEKYERGIKIKQLKQDIDRLKHENEKYRHYLNMLNPAAYYRYIRRHVARWLNRFS